MAGGIGLWSLRTRTSAHVCSSFVAARLRIHRDWLGTSRALIAPPAFFQPSRSNQVWGRRTTRGSYVSRIGHIHGWPSSSFQSGNEIPLEKGLVHLAPPQAPHLGHDPHHHVQRVIRLGRRPRRVPFSGTCSPGLPPSTAALATAPKQILLHVPLPLALRRHGLFMIIAEWTVN
ncbi:MAG TPA: hypothetical protein VF516_37550 [Kofleriaceae bacterium]